MFKRIQFIPVALILLSLISCKGEKKKTGLSENQKSEIDKIPDYDIKNPRSILAAAEHAHGGWEDLLRKQDVEYQYEYRVPKVGADVSTERYIFATEASYGKYTQHDINAFPEINGTITQFFDGKGTIGMVDGKKQKEAKALAETEFLRRANYFWFTMPYKFNDDGTIVKYLGQENYRGTRYHKIEISYDATITGKELNDTYVLYINPKTRMIDRFYFSLPALGITTPVIIAEYKYTDVEGQKIANNRSYFLPNKNGGYGKLPNITQSLSQIKFNNGFTNENITSIEYNQKANK